MTIAVEINPDTVQHIEQPLHARVEIILPSWSGPSAAQRAKSQWSPVACGRVGVEGKHCVGW